MRHGYICLVSISAFFCLSTSFFGHIPKIRQVLQNCKSKLSAILGDIVIEVTEIVIEIETGTETDPNVTG